MDIEHAIGRKGIVGTQFNMTKDEVIEKLGEPEDFTVRHPTILRFGDLQLTFNDRNRLFLATVWLVEGRLRVQSEDIPVAWRCKPYRIKKHLLTLDFEVLEQRGFDFRAKGIGEHMTVGAIFDEQDNLEKISLLSPAYQST